LTLKGVLFFCQVLGLYITLDTNSNATVEGMVVDKKSGYIPKYFFSLYAFYTKKKLPVGVLQMLCLVVKLCKALTSAHSNSE